MQEAEKDDLVVSFYLKLKEIADTASGIKESSEPLGFIHLCVQKGIQPAKYRATIDADEEFRQRCEEAMKVYHDMFAERAIHRSLMEGKAAGQMEMGKAINPSRFNDKPTESSLRDLIGAMNANDVTQIGALLGEGIRKAVEAKGSRQKMVDAFTEYEEVK